jgi:hypothetical protein
MAALVSKAQKPQHQISDVQCLCCQWTEQSYYYYLVGVWSGAIAFSTRCMNAAGGAEGAVAATQVT